MSAEHVEAVRSAAKQGRYQQAIRDGELLLTEGALSPAQAAELHHICSVCENRSGRVFRAIRNAQRAIQIGLDDGLTALVQRVRVNLVGMYVDASDYQLAIDVAEQLLAGPDLPDELRANLPYIYYNVAQAHQGRHDRPQMLNHYREAARLADELGAPDTFRVQIRQQLAWQLLLNEQISEADRHIEAAGALVNGGDSEGQREQLLLACLRAHQAGAFDEALSVAEEFVTPGAPGTKLQIAWAHLICGWVLLEWGHLDEAGRFADRTLDLALELQRPELMNRANRLRHQVNDKRDEAGA